MPEFSRVEGLGFRFYPQALKKITLSLGTSCSSLSYSLSEESAGTDLNSVRSKACQPSTVL